MRSWTEERRWRYQKGTEIKEYGKNRVGGVAEEAKSKTEEWGGGEVEIGTKTGH